MRSRVGFENRWQLAATAAEAFQHPDEFSQRLVDRPIDWLDIERPATVAACLRAAKLWSLDDPPRRFDAHDWWYRTRFPRPTLAKGEQLVLGFDGLATIADVWLNGAPLLSSDNMFLTHERRIDTLLRDDNELVIRFRSLDQLLKARRPRPRWRAPMIENQQLRWFRTTPLGRTPGWSPPAAAAGPWREVWLEKRSGVSIDSKRLVATVENGVGHLSARFRLTGPSLEAADSVTANPVMANPVAASSVAAVRSVELLVERNGRIQRTALRHDPATATYTADMRIADVELWWPHTHGEPALYNVSLAVQPAADTPTLSLAAGAIGFRTISVDTAEGDFRISINGTPVFCRGACWTPLDPVSLTASPAAYAEAIEQVRAAGMNMLRVGGTMVYESDDFLDLCDANGILLWQEFMFANMDYPEEDADFVASVTQEATQQLARLAQRPCLTVLCGNSEVEQQAAMWGAPRERWRPGLFHDTLPKLTAEQCPNVPYWPSSAHGGAFPHQGSAGTTSYYGVGAYLRDLSDARSSAVKFATECLAFANVPEPSGIALMPGGLDVKVHHPQWKARSPRDLGAGWDFDDVRDHYLSEIFGIDPLRLRYSDHERYLALSRVAVGEVMAATFRDWRRSRSQCGGALVWFLKDLWMGAGWGLIDAAGAPKAPYYYLRRALQPTTVFLTDEGGNGLYVHMVNEGPVAIEGTVTISLFRNNAMVGSPAQKAVSLAPHQSIERPAAEFHDNFMDMNHAYGFGPMLADWAMVELKDSAGTRLARDVRPLQRTLPHERDIGLQATARKSADGNVDLEVSSREHADTVMIDVDGFVPEDNYFHLAPNEESTVRLMRRAAAAPLRGFIRALNTVGAVRIKTAE